KSINRQLKEKNDEREKYEAQTVKEELAKKRVKVLTESIKIFQSLYNYRWKDIRRRLDEKIKSIYREISFKSYTPILSEDYHLRLVKQIGNIQEA
ncbi:MAG: hypothetical protein GTO02_14905, partial [Candidatus Dadabacteria bacterium]|nr:hypothetical protein [Candidatus Dadabacteria bacterium]